MSWFRESLEYGGSIRHTVQRVKNIDNTKFRGHTRRYFQLELCGDWQNNFTKQIVAKLTGYSQAVRKADINYQEMIDEADGYVKHFLLEGTNWTLFHVRYIKMREFARVFK